VLVDTELEQPINQLNKQQTNQTTNQPTTSHLTFQCNRYSCWVKRRPCLQQSYGCQESIFI